MSLNRKVILLLLAIVSSVSHAFAKPVSKSAKTATTAVKEDPVANMLLQSMSLIGIPYKWGGNTPNTGLDCSGFIHYVYKKSLGINLPRTSEGMSKLGKNVPLSQLKAGDLLFFSSSGNGHITHVGMYIGKNKFIQSPHTGDSIKITDFDGYYRRTFTIAKRIVQEETSPTGKKVLLDYHKKVVKLPKNPVILVSKHKKNRTSKKRSR